MTANDHQPLSNNSSSEVVIDARNLQIFYGSFHAVKDVSLQINKGQITAFIGPSGCGKSTILRCFNRLNDLISSFRLEGEILYHGENIYSPQVDPVEVRRRIGMVFQKPNPLPKSIFDNVAYGPRVTNQKVDLNEVVETSLKRAALWVEVKDKLKTSGLALSGGQQQRLCIARTIATNPEVVLMDEPCASLDPISTLKIEELMIELKKEYTIIIVTHNMQQAARISDMTAFYNAEATEDGKRHGYLVEYDKTAKIFSTPERSETKDYVAGRFG